MINYSVRYFLSSLHFLHSNVPDNEGYKQKWRVLFFIRTKLVARVLACARGVARIKWRRLSCSLFDPKTIENPVTSVDSQTRLA